MIVASGIAMQFGAKPLFSNVSVKFGGGNRYGLIGANGCGKSTFMKILGGEDFVRAADLEHRYSEYGGYTAEALAAA